MKTVFVTCSPSLVEFADHIVAILQDDDVHVLPAWQIAVNAGRDWSGYLLSSVKRCDVFVALLEDHNPNIMFDLGCAAGCGKDILLFYSEDLRMPFSITSFPAVELPFFSGRIVELVVGAVRSALKRARATRIEAKDPRQVLERICSDQEYLDEVDPGEFENCVRFVLAELGVFVEDSPQRREMGFDFRLRGLLSGGSVALEVKKLSRNGRVSVTSVQRLLGAAIAAKAEAAVLITAGMFTSAAEFFANASPIPMILLTVDDLLVVSRDELESRCRGISIDDDEI